MANYEIRPTDRRRRAESFDDAMAAAKHWRLRDESGVSCELYVDGGRAPADPMDETAAPVYEAIEKLNDELPKVVIFKHEDDRRGVAEGPVTVDADPDLVFLPGAAAFIGKPWTPPCLCEEPSGSAGETCSSCGGEVREPWMTLPEAEEKARELGLEVRET